MIRRQAYRAGVALMEVVMAMTIFFIAAIFVMDALSSASVAVRWAALEADAADLAVTVLSEVQMGLLEIKSEAPEAFDETLFPGWTWEMIVADVAEIPELPLLKRVQVIIRNTDENFTYRTAQWVWDDLAEQTADVAQEVGEAVR